MDRANKTAAAANVRSLIPSVEPYNADNVPSGPNDPDASTTDSGCTDMTIAELKATCDQAIPATDYVNNATPAAEAAGVTTKATLDATHYCVYSQVGNWFAYKLNQAGVNPPNHRPHQGLHLSLAAGPGSESGGAGNSAPAQTRSCRDPATV